MSYQAGPAWRGSLCSRTPPWCLRCSPSTGWSSSWRWSSQCCPPQRRSSTLWEGWSTPGSSHKGRTQSSQFLCTSPPSCTSWWVSTLKTKTKIEVSLCSSSPVYGTAGLKLWLQFVLRLIFLDSFAQSASFPFPEPKSPDEGYWSHLLFARMWDLWDKLD